MTRSVVIIGSGVAGATVAKDLLALSDSDRVVMLEAGPNFEMRDFRTWVDYVTSKTEPHARFRDLPGDYDTLGSAMVLEESRLLVRGGSTLHWSGFAFRFKPEDFRLHSAVGREIDWPISYEDLAPFYHRAEQSLRISGNSLDDDPPRFGKSYVLEAAPYSELDGVFIDALEAENLGYGHVPVARNSECVTTGTCKYCPVGGRFSADMLLDDLTANPRFELRLNSPARRIVMRSNRTAVGVEYIDAQTGAMALEAADLIVVCAGALETPKLLLASADPGFCPAGLGNHSGHVGRHLKTHQHIQIQAQLPSNPRRLQEELDFPTLGTRHFDAPAFQRLGKAFFTRARSPRQDLESLMIAGRPVAEIDSIVSGQAVIGFDGFVEQFSSPDSFVGLAKGETALGLPRTTINFATSTEEHEAIVYYADRLHRVLAAAGATPLPMRPKPPRADHVTSTTRMSHFENEGVVDVNLRVHATDNVFICSNAVMPTVAAVHPTLTLVALAHRLAASL